MKNILIQIKNTILYPYSKIKEKYQLRKKIKELKKRDPFIYK